MEKGPFRFEIEQEDAGKRLDKFLAEHMPEKFSRSFLQKLVAGGSVLVNGQVPKKHHKLSPDESIEINIPEPVTSSIKPEKIPIKIVYEDEHLLVVDKSADMVVHPAPGNYSGTLVNALLWHCKNLSGIGGVLKPGIVHRIDKGTSGLLVVAKTDEAHRFLAKQFKAKTTARAYVALVKGVVQFDNGIVDLPIGRSNRDRKKMAVDFASTKEAVTRYKVLERFKDHTLLEIVLGTGRTHQIRVHMAYIGYPIVGDDKYGSHGLIGRPALHAKTLGFIHPATKKYMEFTSKIPEDMKKLIERVKGQGPRASI